MEDPGDAGIDTMDLRLVVKQRLGGAPVLVAAGARTKATRLSPIISGLRMRRRFTAGFRGGDL